MAKVLITLLLYALAIVGCVYIISDIFGSNETRFEPIDTPTRYTHKNIQEAIFCVHIFNAADPNRAQRVGEMCDEIIKKV